MSLMFHSHKVLYYLLGDCFQPAMVTFEMSYLSWTIQLWNPVSVTVNDFICSFPNFGRVWSLSSQEIFLTFLLRLWLSPRLLVVAGWQLQGRLLFSATPGGGVRLWPELMVSWGELGKAGLPHSLQPLVVMGDVCPQMFVRPDGDPAWPTYDCLSSGV